MTAETRSLRILLALKHAGYVGVYASLVRELAARGHSVHVVCLGTDGDGHGSLDRLCAHPRVSSAPAAHRGVLDGWSSAAWLVRALGDLGRYSDPRFAEASALRERMAAKVQSHLSSAAGFDPLTRRLARRRARQLHARTSRELAERAIRTSSRLEATIGPSRRVTASLRAEAPDVVLVSPLIDLASPLLEYLKAARRLRIPTGICVASWDNLTSKGLLRFVPERVFVWNEIQRREAIDLHGIPAARVVATGGARFDEWFARQPTASREAFAAKVGIDPERPFLLYLCSSAFVAPDEVGAVTGLLEALRGSADGRLRGAGVVVRPHPKRVEPWRAIDLSRHGNAVVWPRPGSTADGAQVQADFYDSIAHCAAVVGANTSAMIEAAIVGKSVYTWLAPEFAQEGTVHFHYLLHENGGFLHVADSQAELLEQLSAGLGRGAGDAERTRRFVESFVRPGGPERSATAIYADAVEELASLPSSEPAKVPGRVGVGIRVGLALIAAASALSLAATVAKSAVRSKLPGARAAARRKPHIGAARA